MASASERFFGFTRLVNQCHRAYGLRAGLRLAIALRRASKVAGHHRIRVPGLISDVILRGCTSDVAVFFQIFLHQELDFALAKAPATIVDGGANIGLSSLYLARKYPGARIIAVEFEASNFALLQVNVSAYPNIVCVHAGLWSHDARLTVGNPDAAKWAYAPVAADAPTATGETVPAVTVGVLLDQHAVARVDFLKLDIEGSEFELFSERPVWLERVQAIAIELHDRLTPGCGMRFVNSIAGSQFRLQTCGEYLLCEFDADSPSVTA